MSDDLVARLKKCINREEAVARDAAPGPWEFSDRGWQLRLTADEPNFERLALADNPTEAQMWAFEHMADHDPARVLREIAAKRAIIEMYEFEVSHGSDASGPICWALYEVIKAYAAVYGLA